MIDSRCTRQLQLGADRARQRSDMEMLDGTEVVRGWMQLGQGLGLGTRLRLELMQRLGLVQKLGWRLHEATAKPDDGSS